MTILLILYFIFLAFYLAFNGYGIFRVLTMRIKNDKSLIAVMIYGFLVLLVVLTTLLICSFLEWNWEIGGLFET